MAGPGLIWAIIRRPRLWGEALRAAAALIPRAWWRQSPRIPVPEQDYLAWRRATAYGSADAPMEPRDVVMFLEWRRCFRRATSHRRVLNG
ncbi:MAG: hypothetical protein GY720_10505 [bacterium]|nr:hypothetical protein [bacterium]